MHAIWPPSTLSASPSCSPRSWCWPASCRVWWRCGSGLRCCWFSSSSACWRANPGRAGSRSMMSARPYLVGAVALALILFDGGLRTRLATFRSVLATSPVLATIGVLLTAAITAPVARWLLGFGWVESLLVGAVVASTDAAAVFLLIHAHGLWFSPPVRARPG